jgi:hypothetical protein
MCSNLQDTRLKQLKSSEMRKMGKEFDVFHPLVYVNKVKWYKAPVQHNYLLKQYYNINF